MSETKSGSISLLGPGYGRADVRQPTKVAARDVRILFFGDSFVNGTGDADYVGWTGRLCARARSHELALTHYNLGIRRDTSADVRRRWRRETSDRLSPEAETRLVFSFGLNDTSLANGRSRIPLDQSLGNFRAVVRAARDWLPTLVIGPPAVAESNRRNSNQRIGALSAAFAASSQELGVPYFDAFAGLRRSPAWQEAVSSGDGVHPSAAGYELLATLISGWAQWAEWLRGDA